MRTITVICDLLQPRICPLSAVSIRFLLMTTEFASAALNYPIVFAKMGDKVMPFVVTGYKQGSNIYVDEDGKWRENFYIPAFVRRYPFIFAENKEQNNLALCIDANCPGLNKEEGEPLYEDGKPAALTLRALEFSKNYHNGRAKDRSDCQTARRGRTLF